MGTKKTPSDADIKKRFGWAKSAKVASQVHGKRLRFAQDKMVELVKFYRDLLEEGAAKDRIMGMLEGVSDELMDAITKPDKDPVPPISKVRARKAAQDAVEAGVPSEVLARQIDVPDAEAARLMETIAAGASVSTTASDPVPDLPAYPAVPACATGEESPVIQPDGGLPATAGTHVFPQNGPGAINDGQDPPAGTGLGVFTADPIVKDSVQTHPVPLEQIPGSALNDGATG